MLEDLLDHRWVGEDREILMRWPQSHRSGSSSQMRRMSFARCRRCRLFSAEEGVECQ